MSAPEETLSAPVQPESTRLPDGIDLFPMNLESAAERDVLYHQRIICGWAEDKISLWQESVAAGERSFFWIGVAETTKLPQPAKTDDSSIARISKSGSDGTSRSILGIGHVALDRVDHPPTGPGFENSGSDLSETALGINSLFVLPAYTGLGIGAFAMDTCERLARELPYGSPSCRAIHINTLSSRYYSPGGTEGPKGMGIWKLLGREAKRSQLPWYIRRGYVPYKESPRYFDQTLDGTKFAFFAVFMRKELGE